MRTPIFIDGRRRQRGSILLDALVGMVIVGLIVAGSIYTVGRGMNTQYSSGLRAQAVEQLRALLMSQGESLCSTTGNTINVGGTSVPVSITCTPYTGVSVTLPSTSLPAVSLTSPQSVTATVNPPTLGTSLSVSSQ